MRIPHVSPKNATGLFDKVIGLGKEIYGEVFNSEDLRRAGELQQSKGSEKLKALREETKADAYKAKAKSSEGAQRGQQRAKENSNA